MAASLLTNSGGTALVKATAERWEQMTGCRISEGYGLTETNAVGCGIINENYVAKPMSTGPASKPLVDLAILDDNGHPLASGEVGEVAIRSVANFLGYWNNEAATHAAIMPDGYFRTGDLGYLDADGYLFITLGENNDRPTAQDLDKLQGKIVRILPDGEVPKDNPFVGQANVRPEIWSYGQRNPQGAALNPWNGTLWENEHGPQGGDELNIDEAGKNYGWPVITYGENYGGGKIGEGTHKEGMEQPVYKWVPSIATAGFIFYTGDKFPQWKNNILLASLREQTLVRLTLDGEMLSAGWMDR